MITDRVRQARVHSEILKRLWSEHYGIPWPDERLACHHCDDGRCCNPEHVFPGTYSDNLNDAYAKGRKQSGFGLGEEHHNAKLTPALVLKIRRRVLRGERQIDVARDLKVSQAAVCRIVKGQRWGWLRSRTA